MKITQAHWYSKAQNECLSQVTITSPETLDRLENQSKDGPATTESLLRAGEKLRILFKAKGYSTLRPG